ncbi:MAG: stage II sporulation protein M [Hymenobacteraceae bacterium]|nr:stage II sporulation protein M [Hymenobacteraceae bacterium]
MREAVFLARNRARWQQYQQTPAASPDELAARFVALTDDLAYARTFYPDSPITEDLNALAGQFHQRLYRTKREGTNRFWRFWRTELPLVVARHHRTLAFALAFFAFCALLGALSAALDDTFVRLILGDGYVNMTLANIKRGDPMAVYKGSDEAPMFLYITLNNINVALKTFAAGVLAGIGTAYVLFQNGVMLGAFQYFFYQHGVLAPSLLTIWIHGTLEISAIIIAGGAGFVLGRGLLLPGTYPRGVSFRAGAREGMKLALGIVPVLVIAGFLEGFVTRHTEMPIALSLLIIGASLAFIVWYFVVYPRRVARAVAAVNLSPEM